MRKAAMLLPFLLVCCRVSEQPELPPIGFRVFVYGKPPVDYLDPMGADGVAWSVYHGGYSEEDHDYVKMLHIRGGFVASNFPTMQGSEWVTGDESFAASTACQDFEGEPSMAGWIQPDPPYLPCHNNPDWEQFMFDRLKDHVRGEADAIHIDEIEGIGGHLYAAGFCKWCMARFSEYLARKYSAEELRSKFSIDGDFNYRDYLLSKGAHGLDEDPNPELRREFVLFQLESRRDQITRIATAARKQEVRTAANTFFLSPNKQFFIPHLDLLVFENSLELPPRGKYTPLFLLSRAIRRETPAVMFPNIVNMANYDEKDAPLIRHYFLEAFASGGSFLVPYRAYVFGGGQASVQGEYTVAAAEMAPATLLARKLSSLMEQAEPVSELALLYDYRSALNDYLEAGYRTPWVAAGNEHESFLGTALALLEAHYSIDVVFAGSEPLFSSRLDLSALPKYKAVAVRDISAVSPEARTALDRYDASGGIVIEVGEKGRSYYSAREQQNREALVSAFSSLGISSSFGVSGCENCAFTLWLKGSSHILHAVNHDYDQAAKGFKSAQISVLLPLACTADRQATLVTMQSEKETTLRCEEGRLNAEFTLEEYAALEIP